MEAVNLNPMIAPIESVQPNGSRGGTFIYVIVVIVLLVSLVAAGFFFYKSQSRTVIDLSKSAGPSPVTTPPEDDSNSDLEPPEDDSSVNVEPLDTEPTTVKQSTPQLDIASVVKFVTPTKTEETPTSRLNDLKTDVKLVTPVIIKAAPPPPTPTLGNIRERVKL
jgi:hypothetical protein